MGPALSFPQAMPSASWSTGRRPSLRSCRGCTPSQKGERPPVTDGGAWGTTGGLRSQHASSRGRPRWPWAAGVRGLGGGERLEQAGGGTGRRHTGRPVPGSWAHASAPTTKWSPEARSGQQQDGFPVRTQCAQRRRLSPQAYDQEPRDGLAGRQGGHGSFPHPLSSGAYMCRSTRVFF